MDKRDSIDWGRTSIPRLFVKMFFPTLFGMLLASTVNIVDGIFVGHGVGSDALAAVNIVAPFFLITTGVGLMFGSGVSIVASVHLSHGNVKAANINITQAFAVGTLLMVAVAAAVMAFPAATARLLGASEGLTPFALEYMRWIIPALPFYMLISIGLFVLRLDGSPVWAMACNIAPAAINVVLDYVFIFPLGMGIGGAALATALSAVAGTTIVFVYMLWLRRTVGFRRVKLSRTSLALTARNIGYQMKLGASSLIGELAIACTMLTGNFAFIRRLGDDGVAAFSVACYCFPLVFMVGNAIAQSAQPILSYNYGAGQPRRVRETLRLSLWIAVVCGLLMSLLGVVESGAVVSVFLPASAPASHIAADGLPYFSLAFLFFALNLVVIGYFQSLERFKRATFLMLLRGFVFVVPAFLLLPFAVGDHGLWLAVPLAEALTFAVIALKAAVRR
jgi:putative MATE family efflux protein